MKKVTGWVVLCAVFSVASVSLGGYVDEDWDSGFSDGAALGGQWSGSAIVSNSAAYLASGTAATNTVTVTPGGAPSKIWTDFDITPALGVEPTAPATSDSSTLFYFNADGRIVVWNAGEDDWSTCTTDVWGGSVDVIDAQVRVSIYQDYTDDTFALFLDGQCLIQDVDFPAGASSTLYSKFVIANTDSNAVVDDVYVHVTAPSGHTTKNDIDLGHASDVLEMDELGHVARTLYVKNGGTPEFDTISEAVAVARTGDEIKIGAAYLTTDEPVVLSNNVAYVFNGAALETGAFTANGDVTFESNADLDSLAIANGVTVTGASGIDIDAAALTMVAGALLDVTSGSFSEADAGLELEGSFQIDGGDWVAQASGIAPRELIINETFETYVDGKGI
ncbi:MAG: hypothetical protein HN341_18390, partial [Verrucomicrobia bacterium]|nr:hypothetical protein [Verrucomicrobiota bacterium]